MGFFPHFLDRRRYTLKCGWWDESKPAPSDQIKTFLSTVRNYSEQEVVFENQAAGIKLYGTLTKPFGKGSFPAILLITGAGPIGRENSYGPVGMFTLIADRLAQHGIAALRYDKRGVGQSAGLFADAALLEFADDASAGMAYLRTLNDINARSVGVLGHSDGALVASIVASREKNTAFAILMAMAGRSFEARNIDYLVTENRAAGHSTISIEKIVANQRILNEW